MSLGILNIMLEIKKLSYNHTVESYYQLKPYSDVTCRVVLKMCARIKEFKVVREIFLILCLKIDIKMFKQK